MPDDDSGTILVGIAAIGLGGYLAWREGLLTGIGLPPPGSNPDVGCQATGQACITGENCCPGNVCFDHQCVPALTGKKHEVSYEAPRCDPTDSESRNWATLKLPTAGYAGDVRLFFTPNTKCCGNNFWKAIRIQIRAITPNGPRNVYNGEYACNCRAPCIELGDPGEIYFTVDDVIEAIEINATLRQSAIPCDLPVIGPVAPGFWDVACPLGGNVTMWFA